MKKLLLTLIVSLAFCGSIFAQYSNPNGYESYWDPQFHSLGLGDVDYPAFFVKLNGEWVTEDGNWADLEFASIINGEVRGHDFMTTEYLEMGWPLPMLEGLMIKYDDPGDVVSFKVYNHVTHQEYDATCNITISTGEDHIEDWLIFDDDWNLIEGWEDEVIYLSFTMEEQEGYTLEIDPYTVGEKDHYYLIASPVGGIAASAVEGLRTPNFDFYSFNPAEGLEWINHRDEENYELQPGVGYLYANSTGTDLVFNGNPLEGVAMEYTYTITDGGEGLDFPDWNLVGNPFAETVTLNVPFLTMNDLGTDYVTNDEGGELPAMTGAFVHGVTSVAFTKADAGKKTSRLDLNLSNNRGLIDRAIVSFSQGQQMPKFQLRDSNTKVYIPMDGNDYSLVRSEGMGELPVNFKAEKSGSYTLSFNAEEVSFGYLHLIDNMTGADVDLLQTPSYSFSASSTDYASRFKLVFATGSANDDNFAFYSNGSLVINNEGNATVQVIDVTGRIISSETIEGCANVSVNAAPGVYMIRLVNGDNMKVQKMVVR